MATTRLVTRRDLLDAQVPGDLHSLVQKKEFSALVSETAKKLRIAADLDSQNLPPLIYAWIIIATAQARHYRDEMAAFMLWLKTEAPTELRTHVEYLYAAYVDRNRAATASKTKRALERARGRGKIDIGYDWLAEAHFGPELQKALGYGKTAFTIAVAALPRARQFRRRNPKDAAKNSASIYGRDAAVFLLAYRLERVERAAAKKYAGAILQFLAQQTEGGSLYDQQGLSLLKKHIGQFTSPG